MFLERPTDSYIHSVISHSWMWHFRTACVKCFYSNKQKLFNISIYIRREMCNDKVNAKYILYAYCMPFLGITSDAWWSVLLPESMMDWCMYECMNECMYVCMKRHNYNRFKLDSLSIYPSIHLSVLESTVYNYRISFYLPSMQYKF